MNEPQKPMTVIRIILFTVVAIAIGILLLDILNLVLSVDRYPWGTENNSLKYENVNTYIAVTLMELTIFIGIAVSILKRNLTFGLFFLALYFISRFLF